MVSRIESSCLKEAANTTCSEDRFNLTLHTPY
jgi:hypothetical protein